MADGGGEAAGRVGPFDPLRHGLFRRIWTASLFSNFGQLIQGVGAAWAMTQLTGRADMVALVQSATFAPLMLLSLFAGAIADSYDRRKIALTALSIALLGALGLSLVTALGLLTPAWILFFCFVVGTGTALFGPAWQSSVGEQVPPRELAQAIALNSISYNIARSFGPAIGGLLVALAGVLAAFAFNALAYIPLIVVMVFWRRLPETSRLPPEALGRAVISGARYVVYSPPIRAVLVRTLLIAFAGVAASALMPLVARELLKGDATLYGVLLGCFGGGAVLGALFLTPIKERLSDEVSVGLASALMGLCMIGTGLSRHGLLTGLLVMGAGSGWMISMALCNINIQMSSPRWVTGRALAACVTAVCGGMTIGGWAWGRIAASEGTGLALVASGTALILTIAASLVWRMPAVEEQRDRDTPLSEPETNLDLNGRSGPIVVTIEYRVPLDQARDFYTAMMPVEAIRHRTGGYGWSISRDVGDPELWTERYHTPTWHDYLRQRSRLTVADLDTWQKAIDFHRDADPIRVRRKLERPYGSVRWREDVPDRGVIVPLPSPGS
ncbi:MFS transporter [Sphingomonas histidinilytica]|jgi:MFS family permease|uniref:Predicted arabinose efflux permease, MFS family n=1 Tax=Rhizorhabdus histidinilytica TaxID=439228 RepID=A0A1T5A9J1_9SPHN|nr:MFS transporter [Rhizorhabdus histidinilytica]MBO9377308.1 MFS transporter [Rhizorhabdus histidinilytica]QEH78154.1 MFS transporter [Sphingomonas sp. C8-2]SKB31674.1 Predicted arabinose efflux permease, MFS family [Rhizorhabdus histidinilytica]